MKRLILIISVIVGMTIASNAQSTTSTKNEKSKTEVSTTKKAETTNIKGNFVDKNNDGVCDNHQMKGKNKDCQNFVDANNDGICDNHKAKGNCCGKGHSNNNGKHRHVKGHCCDKKNNN